VYAPEVVAEAILHCAEHPMRDVITGGMGKMLSVANDFPRLADRYMERTTFESQKTTKPAGDRPSNLYEPVEHDGGERGQNWSGRTKSTSLYTKAALHRDVIGAAAAVGLGLAAATAAARRLTERSKGGPREDVPAPDKASANESDSR
jgi:hypothetical protein